MEVKLYFRREGETRIDTIKVYYKSNIDNVFNDIENFSVDRMHQDNTFLESKAFHSFTDRKWNFAELEFFCLNNNICLEVYDWNESTLLRSIGACSISAPRGDFNNDFNNDFFNT